LSCYEYDPKNETIHFLQDILELPLRDSTIIKQDGKYWIFGTMSENGTDYKLYVFFSYNLLGPYVSHPLNPIKNGLDGNRPAGNFIVIDGIIYRPTQNCQVAYGESMTINKVIELNEHNVVEESYMNIKINKNNRFNFGMHTIHTINVMNDIIVVDGIKWTFSPIIQLQYFLKSRIKARQLKR
jgi:beta-xylosidase